MIFAIELLAEPVLAPVDVFSIVIISYTTESWSIPFIYTYLYFFYHLFIFRCYLRLDFCYYIDTFFHYYIDRGQSWHSGTKCDWKTDWLWVRSPLDEMKYLLKFIFPFLRSGVEVTRGVEICHSTRNASRIRQKVGNLVLTRFPTTPPTTLCLSCCVRDTAWSWFILIYIDTFWCNEIKQLEAITEQNTIKLVQRIS